MKKNIKYDLVIIGATGFTGKLVVEYLLKEYGAVNKEFTWAIAGRNHEKLDALRKKFEQIDPLAKELNILTSNNHDIASLDKITSVSKLIITTVGPYLKYGKLLVESCVRNGTHYCDLTGEVPFIRDSIDSFDLLAKDNKSRIIHSCGFDSIPSDIGVFFLQKFSISKYKVPCDEIKLYVRSTRGGLSGGTIDSMINISEYIKNRPKLGGLLGNPYALDPTLRRFKSSDKSSLRTIKWDEEMMFWTAPFIMSGINTRVVRRSNALLNFQYGNNFRYNEVSSFSKGLLGFMKSLYLLMGIGLVKIFLSYSFSSWVIRKFFLPSPGQGPSRNKREEGHFKLLLIGKIDGEKKVSVTITGDRDPGYAGTAKMLAEAALSLLLEEKNIPKSYGVLTPAAGFGDVIIDRLKNKGIIFKIDEIL